MANQRHVHSATCLYVGRRMSSVILRSEATKPALSEAEGNLAGRASQTPFSTGDPSQDSSLTLRMTNNELLGSRHVHSVAI